MHAKSAALDGGFLGASAVFNAIISNTLPLLMDASSPGESIAEDETPLATHTRLLCNGKFFRLIKTVK